MYTEEAARRAITDAGEKLAIEPTLLGRANELLNHISTAQSHCAAIRDDLFGESESDLSGQPKDPTTLAGMMVVATERVACLCGELATLRDRLGCPIKPSR